MYVELSLESSGCFSGGPTRSLAAYPEFSLYSELVSLYSELVSLDSDSELNSVETMSAALKLMELVSAEFVSFPLTSPCVANLR